MRLGGPAGEGETGEKVGNKKQKEAAGGTGRGGGKDKSGPGSGGGGKGGGGESGSRVVAGQAWFLGPGLERSASARGFPPGRREGAPFWPGGRREKRMGPKGRKKKKKKGKKVFPGN